MKGCRPLTEAEIEYVLPHLNKLRDRALFISGCKLGFRISELLSLSVQDVYAYGKMKHLVSLKRQNTKGKIEGRTLPLHVLAKAVLLEYIQTQHLQPNQLLFPISRIQAYRVLRQAFESAQLVGKLGTHCMRKTFANNVYEKLDKDLLRTQKALGHKSINSTTSYLSFKQEDIDEAILAL